MVEFTVLMQISFVAYATYIFSEVFILKLALTIIQLILSLALSAIVLLQQSRRTGLSGTISGAADTFLSKNKAASVDAKLAKLTAVIAAIFIIITLVLNLGFIA